MVKPSISENLVNLSYILDKTNHLISYNDIRIQNTACSKMVSKDRLYFPYLCEGVATYSTKDISDGRQETLPGSNTTHGTSKTIFQVLSSDKEQDLPMIVEQERPLLLNDEPRF